jgi:uncharacterized protein (TIGR03435 family)
MTAGGSGVRTCAALIVLFSARDAYSQNPAQPHFEVASIRPGGDLFSTRPQRSPGRLTWTTQLVYLIGYAYGLDISRVNGQGTGAVYSINAVFDAAATDGELRLMLQSLLADRFGMRFHRVVKEADGYAISIDKGGVKMKESDPSSPGGQSYVSATLPAAGITAIEGRKASVSQLAETLGRVSGTPFWDQSALQGQYDFDFRYSMDLSADAQTSVPSLVTALRETLGLTIQKRRGPFETLVIDHIEQPSEN